MADAIRVGIYGAAGYAGQDLVEILAKHPQVELVFATSNNLIDQFVPGTSLRYVRPDEAELDAVEAVFLAVPHTTAAPLVVEALKHDVRVIDLSADLRLRSPEAYEQWYGVPHPHPELLPVPYGLPEIHRDEIRGSQVVAVPGCYPTTVLLGLYPLLQTQGVASVVPIIVDAKSGVSGAGRAPTDKTHFVEVFGNLTPYKVGRSHRHVGEMEQEIYRLHGYAGPLIFTPHLIPVARGLMASIYVSLNYNISSDQVYNLYANVYSDEPLIYLLPVDEVATLRDAVLRNHCAISITPVTENYVQITSVTDNLRKGASSQAVQCFNLMFGLTETTALL